MAKNDTVTDEMIGSCLKIFDEARSGLRLTPKEGTLLRMLADSGIEMVDCYRTDVENFVRTEDYVTAFAAINYSHAWIGCFTELGLFDSEPGDELFKLLKDSDSKVCGTISDEKMAKYLDITTRARKKLKIASPVRSFDRRLAIRFLDTSESYFKEAVDYRKENDYVRAFAAVNYAHAWLDGGARIGLFDVEEDDVLFTLFE
ncbi:MAG: DUF357 domain-containing protein [Thermoplasmata archaeon]|nr:DUF357 domain-containing protein [Thermoplasmata archaeon]